MADIKSPKVIWIKGLLFLAMGFLASGLLLLRAPSITVAMLLGVAVWSFCRFYYFAFYVIEHYVDPSYKFSGLTAFVLYAIRTGWRSGSKPEA
jgi:hypothetical protein